MKYNELFAPRLPAFVRAVWEVIGASTLAVREDTTVSQAIKFLSITVKTGLHTQLFSQQETLELLIERIVLPNMLLRGESLFLVIKGPQLTHRRVVDHEIEQFEDDPLEYIRRDLSVNTEGQTRRHSAADLLKALISNGLEREVTTIVERYVAKGLEVINPRYVRADAH